MTFPQPIALEFPELLSPGAQKCIPALGSLLLSQVVQSVLEESRCRGPSGERVEVKGHQVCSARADVMECPELTCLGLLPASGSVGSRDSQDWPATSLLLPPSSASGRWPCRPGGPATRGHQPLGFHPFRLPPGEVRMFPLLPCGFGSKGPPLLEYVPPPGPSTALV